MVEEKKFLQELTEKIETLNKIIFEYLPREDGMFERIGQASNYSVKAGGKRLRPMFVMETYRLCNGDPENERIIYPFLAGIEFIHSASLVHDDLPAMDNDLLRRGKPTTHAVYGEDFGILAGDALIIYAFEVMLKGCVDSGNIACAKAAWEFAHKSGIYGMVGGQSLDVLLTGKKIEKDELKFIFEHKTADLIEASMTVGAILAGASDETVEKISKAGQHIGIAFQIRDDILDEKGTTEEIGKPVHSDEKNDKTTYVTLFGMEKAESDVKEMSDEALEILKSIGNNPFLFDLITEMITRKK